MMLIGLLGLVLGAGLVLSAGPLVTWLGSPDHQQEAQSAVAVLACAAPAMLLGAAGRGVLEALLAFGRINAVRVPAGILTVLGPWSAVMQGASLVDVAWVLVGDSNRGHGGMGRAGMASHASLAIAPGRIPSVVASAAALGQLADRRQPGRAVDGLSGPLHGCRSAHRDRCRALCRAAGDRLEAVDPARRLDGRALPDLRRANLDEVPRG
jgi:hypothetical protein